MNTFIACIKREFWEHKSSVLWLPVAWSVFIVGMFIFSTVALKTNSFDFSVNNEPISLGAVTVTLDLTEDLEQVSGEEYLKIFDAYSEGGSVGKNLGDMDESDDFWKQAIIPFISQAISVSFFSISWCVAIFYLLSCLFEDRKDRSILFWKSLPVSESTNVFTKLFFGLVVIIGISIVFSWFIQVFIATGITFLGDNLVSRIPDIVLGSLDFGGMIMRSLVSLLLGLLWGLPIFAYILFISAVAKKSPFTLALVPVLVVATLEFWFFRTAVLTDTILQHSPVQSFSNTSSIQGLYLNISENLTHISMGLLLSLLLIYVSIWLRKYRFEA